MTARTTPEGASRTRYLTRPGGRIAYDVTGTGPLVVCAPGMGDVRFVYRHLVPRLVEAGYRVATMDLRGHGESDATFDSYDDPATGEDLLALIGHLDSPGVVVGNSMSAAAAVWAAAENPGAIAGLVLLGPFVRDVPVGRAALLAQRMGLRRPWGPSVWTSYYARLYPGPAPDDLADHQAHIRAALARPGAWRAFLATTRTSHTAAEARLAQVHAPTLVVMGENDPDFPDPAAEARLVADRLNGRTLLVPGAGHYPQAQHPDVVAPEIARFLSEVLPHA